MGREGGGAMIPPVLRPSSLPGLAECPHYSPDQDMGQEQKSDGTKRHTALGLYLADDPDWRRELGDWDAEGVEWAGEYIRTHAPLADHQVQIEEPGIASIPMLADIRGTPDIYCGPVLFDLKGRDIGSYREQMDAYVLMRHYPTVEVHVLYATERRAEVHRIFRAEAEARVSAIVERVDEATISPAPQVCDWCGWCANRTSCPALAAVSQQAARATGLDIPSGPIEEVKDGPRLRALKLAADAVEEWAKAAKAHIRDMAIKHGVLPDGFTLRERKGAAKITDAWAAINAAGIPIEIAAGILSLSVTDLVRVYGEHHGMKATAARADIETRLGPIIERGSNVMYLTPTK